MTIKMILIMANNSTNNNHNNNTNNNDNNNINKVIYNDKKQQFNSIIEFIEITTIKNNSHNNTT